jgi:two-component system NtrC family sensor kinase
MRLRISPPRGLAARLVFAVTAAAVATLGALSLLALREQERHVEDVVARSVALLSDSVRNSTHAHMLADRRGEAYATMRAIGLGEGVDKVRIFNKEVCLTFSTDESEIGSVVDKRAESCYACHEQDRPLERLTVKKRSRVYRARDGHRVLGMVTPIYNEPSCAGAACHAHPASQRVLGVADIGVSLREIDADFSRLRRRTLLAASGGLLLLAAGVSLFARRLVVEPVAALVRGTERIARGELDHRIEVRGPDELGRLAASFNEMSAALAAAKLELQGLLQGLERKVDERTAALKEAQSQLVQSAKLASLGRLAASIAHEINNPLAGILTYARLLLRTLAEDSLDGAARGECLRNLGLVEREARRCTQIVANLLDFARQRPLDSKPMSVEAALEEALSLLQHQLQLKSVVLEKAFAGVPPIGGDFGQLRQAFVNVLLNACDAMEKGGRLTVETRATDGPTIEVSVQDTGAGIAPEHLQQIFDPFFTTKQKGTGLGLSVVHGIVERHGGRLEVQSELGRGTRLTIVLPGVKDAG